jgi:hypothetical protein
VAELEAGMIFQADQKMHSPRQKAFGAKRLGGYRGAKLSKGWRGPRVRAGSCEQGPTARKLI